MENFENFREILEFQEPPKMWLPPLENVARLQFERERRAFKNWLRNFSAPVADAFWSDLGALDGATADVIRLQGLQMLSDLHAMLDALFLGDRYAAWVAIGAPPALSAYAGVSTYPSTQAEWDLEIYIDAGDGPGMQRPKRPDTRRRAVREDATARVWQSVQDLAAEIGASRVYISQHLGGRHPSVKGRVFRYADGS